MDSSSTSMLSVALGGISASCKHRQQGAGDAAPSSISSSSSTAWHARRCTDVQHPPPTPASPYARLGGTIRRRTPPTRMPRTPCMAEDAMQAQCCSSGMQQPAMLELLKLHEFAAAAWPAFVCSSCSEKRFLTRSMPGRVLPASPAATPTLNPTGVPPVTPMPCLHATENRQTRQEGQLVRHDADDKATDYLQTSVEALKTSRPSLGSATGIAGHATQMHAPSGHTVACRVVRLQETSRACNPPASDEGHIAEPAAQQAQHQHRE